MITFRLKMPTTFAHLLSHADIFRYPFRIFVLTMCLSVFGISEGIDRNLEPEYPYELDLLPKLPVNHNQSRVDYSASAVSLAPNRTSRALLLVDEYRPFQVDPGMIRQLQTLLINSTEVTLLATIKQQPDNAGTVAALYVDKTRAIELRSRGSSKEIVIVLQNGTRTQSAVVPYELADNQWHKLAMTLEANRAVLRLNCKTIFEYPVAGNVFDMLRWRNISLWIGQRNVNPLLNREQFKGALLEAKVRAGPNGYLSQCPKSSLPASAQQLSSDDQDTTTIYKLQKQVDSLENKIRQLATRLGGSENRLLRIEEQSAGSCNFPNGTSRADDETWDVGCRSCTCRKGVPSCHQLICQAACDDGFIPEGHCCPICNTPCTFMGIDYKSGESISQMGARGCTQCTCKNGRNECVPHFGEMCPALTCPESDQVYLHGQCCKSCGGPGSCGTLSRCPENAMCVNFSDWSKAVCKCKPGFTGDGTVCTDVNECLANGPGVMNQCQGANLICVNTPGSFKCQCLPGYERLVQKGETCQDIDECQRNSSRCDTNAKCSNTVGSYSCQCLPGYEGDGFTCNPICVPACQNGGHCFAPNTCACIDGHFGPECQQTYRSMKLVSSGADGSLFPMRILLVISVVAWLISHR